MIDCHLTSLHIHDDQAGAERIDLFHLYFDGEGTLRFPWGVAGTRPFVRSQWTGIIETKFARTVALVPRAGRRARGNHLRAELADPQRRFHLGAGSDRGGTGSGSLSVATVAAVNWQDYYVRAGPAEPSGFFQRRDRREHHAHHDRRLRLR